MWQRIKYSIGLLLALLTFNKCGLMNSNPIYKYNPIDVFASPQLELAQAIRAKRAADIPQLVRRAEGMDLDAAGKDGMTLLFWALAHRDPQALEQLLRAGVDPNVAMGEGEEAVFAIAMAAGGAVDENFHLLLRHGANPSGTMKGTPATFKAVYARRFDRMRALLDREADIDAVDGQTNNTLVHFCAVLKLFEQVAHLIERGADFTIGDGVGGSVALEVQEERGRLNEATEKWRAKVEELLIAKGVEFPVPQPWLQK
ncbi:MAG: ankyrin repeat domain-containing protein [Bacteroidota bacterium]